MSTIPLQELRAERAHYSFSSVNSFINICALQWKFQRIDKIPPPFTSHSLVCGSTFHRCCEWLYLNLKAGTLPKKTEAGNLFCDLWNRQLKEEPDVKFPEDTTANDCCEEGRRAIEALVDHVSPEETVLSVNSTFCVPLVSDTGEVLEKPLLGEIDYVVERDGKAVLGDWKTSNKRWPAQKARRDLQPTCSTYAWAQGHQGTVPSFEFTVVVKNKQPVCEVHTTARTRDDHARLFKLVQTMESMIQAGHFMPSEQSFYCGNCPYRETACKTWHKQQHKVISTGRAA